MGWSVRDVNCVSTTAVASLKNLQNATSDFAGSAALKKIIERFGKHYSCHLLRECVMIRTKQPKKLTTDGVDRKCETSSLAMFDHSCARNALLEMVNGALNYNREMSIG
jgi:hypothetical protein